MTENFLMSLIGGAIIGLATAVFLVFNGRVTGISGIINGFLGFVKEERLWRGAFLLGLVLGGFLLSTSMPEFFVNTSDRPLWLVAVAGLIVGYGTLMGSGCTSGHGVCGIARFSIRSLIATVVFMTMGMLIATALGAL
ncbi:YeeE/YedE family protein [Bdellovibrio sp. HCB2-146]|uniref:YeeE/YedE family protein n=1 Tax=Bdellovibrio sp. HCB2-146 TaxID=3394362 RepID=UPI0039BC2FD2